MPTSHFCKIPSVMGILDFIEDVRSVLDIGAGFGKYGLLLREHLDIRKGRLISGQWKIKIDGVEAFNHDLMNIYPYNKIYSAEIKDLLSELGEYDLIVIADVLEYMEKSVGLDVLMKLYRKHCKKGIVISYAPELVRRVYPTQSMPVCTWLPEDFNQGFTEIKFRGTQVVYLFK